MILVDALYNNSGGGKVLLDYLIQELEKTDKKIFYLLDSRIKDNIMKIKDTNRVLFISANLIKRHLFYKENKNLFSTVLCFGNLPPNIRLKAKVYTYFHQLLFLKLAGDLSVKQRVLYWLKTKILNRLKKNTDYWLVQTDLVQKQFSKKYKEPLENILLFPFYEELPSTQSFIRLPKTYVYVSNATPHKNHKLLIEAFDEFYSKNKVGKLFLTVSEDFSDVFNLILEKQKLKIPIINLGYVGRDELSQIYQQSEYMIFPSLTESFGLPLIESISKGCKVIASDLPYTEAVCEPSIKFNPMDKQSIINALSLSLLNDKLSVSKVENKINQLLQLLK